MHLDFAGQTVVVTGGTRGIGRAIAEAFLASGARVVATYCAGEESARAFLEAAGSGGRLEVDRFDVADRGACEGFFKRLDQRHESVEVLVNNAGIRRDGLGALMSEADWRSVLDVDLTGAFHMATLAIRRFVRNRYGRIVNITSPTGRLGYPGQANYAAAKAGLEGMSRTLAREVSLKGITVNCVCPGFVDTQLLADLDDERRAACLEVVPMKRFGAPAEVAACVLFLASRQASYVTGATLDVTGGV